MVGQVSYRWVHGVGMGACGMGVNVGVFTGADMANFRHFGQKTRHSSGHFARLAGLATFSQISRFNHI